jgi:hypothetical protein
MSAMWFEKDIAVYGFTAAVVVLVVFLVLELVLTLPSKDKK